MVHSDKSSPSTSANVPASGYQAPLRISELEGTQYVAPVSASVAIFNIVYMCVEQLFAITH